MSKFKPVENWFLIEKKFLYWSDSSDKAYINLALKMWEDMRYHKLDYELIDFPWEYDIDGITINAYVGRWDLLSYVILFDWNKIWIIGSEDVLNIDEVWLLDTRYYTDDKILNKIDQLELEWEKIKLEKAPD